MTPPDSHALTSFDLDCQRCGACCAPRTGWPTYVHVRPAEQRRLPLVFASQVFDGELATVPDLPTPKPGAESDDGATPLARQRSREQDNNSPEAGSRELRREQRGMQGGVRCVALDGVLGVAVGCQIHSVRPRVCREFRAGSRRCLEAREEVLALTSEASPPNTDD